MSIGDRKEREREALSERIVAAAYSLVEEGGIGAVSIRAIAERIDYSPRTIYLHFKDKDALLDAVRLKGFRALGAALSGAGAGLGPADALRALGRAYLRFSTERRTLFSAMCFRVPREAGGCRTDDGEYPAFSALLSACAAYLGAGSPADPRARSLAFALWGMVHGLASLTLFGQDADFEGLDLLEEFDRALGILLPAAPEKKETA